MSTNSKIEWCDSTWNPVSGCTKVSEGCAHCYAARFAGRGLGEWKNRPFNEVRCHKDRLTIPLHWRKPRRIFVNSMSDLFHELVAFADIDKVLAVAAICPQHTFMVLTKRPERMVEYFKLCDSMHWDYGRLKNALPNVKGRNVHQNIGDFGRAGYPLPNLWLGVSVEDQAAADQRIPLLLQTPAAVRFVSCEPLLGPVDLTKIVLDQVEGHGIGTCRNALSDAGYGAIYHVFPRSDDRAPLYGGNTKLDWVIAGGETGPGARPMHPDWARGLRDQAKAAEVPYFFKGWGEWAPFDKSFLGGKTPMITGTRFCAWINDHWNYGLLSPDPGQRMLRVGKARAGRLLDGREWNELPEAKS